MPSPAADIEIDAPLVQALPRAQHPDLAHLPLRPLVTAYGGIDADLEQRSRGWATWFALMPVAMAEDGRPGYEAAGRAALRRLQLGRS